MPRLSAAQWRGLLVVTLLNLCTLALFSFLYAVFSLHLDGGDHSYLRTYLRAYIVYMYIYTTHRDGGEQMVSRALFVLGIDSRQLCLELLHFIVMSNSSQLCLELRHLSAVALAGVRRPQSCGSAPRGPSNAGPPGWGRAHQPAQHTPGRLDAVLALLHLSSQWDLLVRFGQVLLEHGLVSTDVRELVARDQASVLVRGKRKERHHRAHAQS